MLHPHDDALVVTLQIASFVTRRILVDNNIYADIMFWDAFTKMGIGLDRQLSAPMLLMGFIRDVV